MKFIPGYDNQYAVDEAGNIYSLYHTRQPRKLKPQISTGGYLKVMLYHCGKPQWAYIHRLVAEAYCPKPKGCEIVNHIDANPQNCSAPNLEWVTQAANIAHSRKLGNQNQDKPVVIITPEGAIFQYGSMREASRELFGGPLVLRGQFRRKGRKFIYRGFSVEVN